MKTLFIVYDNGSYIHWFPQGIAYLIDSAKSTEVSVYNQAMNHHSKEHLKIYLDHYKFDFICLSFIGGYYQYQKAVEIGEIVNESKYRDSLKFILGGHGPSPEPKFFLNKLKADIVVIGEGEEQLKLIIQGNHLTLIKGIAYIDNGNFIQNKKLDKLPNVDAIHVNSYHYFDINYYRLLRVPNCDTTDFVMPVLSGRGCPYQCNFCYRMHKGYRRRDIEVVKEEILYLNRNWGINYIVFSDELLMVSESRVEEMCKMLEPLNIKWNCNGRLNIAAKYPKILKLMKDSGCVFINYGIESFDDNALKLMNKKLTCEEVIKGIENTKQVDISPGINIIFGNHGETKDILYKGVQLLLDYDDHSQLRTIRPVTPYPGSELFYDAIEMGLIEDIKDFYENKHLNSDLMTCNFTNLSDDYFYYHLLKANRILLRRYHNKKLENSLEEVEFLYNSKNINFRGFRQT